MSFIESYRFYRFKSPLSVSFLSALDKLITTNRSKQYRPKIGMVLHGKTDHFVLHLKTFVITKWPIFLLPFSTWAASLPGFPTKRPNPEPVVLEHVCWGSGRGRCRWVARWRRGARSWSQYGTTCPAVIHRYPLSLKSNETVWGRCQDCWSCLLVFSLNIIPLRS